MQPNITFTDAACSYIKKMLEKEHGLGFRLSVKKTGCSGYAYQPTIVTTPIENDIAIEIAPGLTLFLDPQWLHCLEDLQVDYVEDAKSGLKQKRLLFTNAKETGRCGCGESFHIE